MLRQWLESLLASRDMVTPVEQFSFRLCDVKQKTTRGSAVKSGAVCNSFLDAWVDWYEGSFKAYIYRTDMKEDHGRPCRAEAPRNIYIISTRT